MILENLAIRGMTGKKRMVIEGGHIQAIRSMEDDGRKNDTGIQFNQAVAFPGFINSHDHLDFNLFPLLANRVYENYTEWALDIQQSGKKEIDAILKIPEAIRIEWGCYKNLLNGFTTVVNHGKKLDAGNFPITIFQSCTSLHSAAFEKCWRLKLNNPFAMRRVVAMHIGEGRDEMAVKEIDEVARWNFLGRRIIAIHGVAMNKKQAQRFKGLVWCPASNQELIGATAAIKELEMAIPVVFGTDSTLSSAWNAWEHFRSGLRQPGITEQQLLEMLTSVPAALWGLEGKGRITEKADADLVIVEAREQLFENNPENILLVMQKGMIRLYDESLAGQVQLPGFSKVAVDKRVKFVQGDLPGLVQRIRAVCPAINLPVTI